MRTLSVLLCALVVVFVCVGDVFCADCEFKDERGVWDLGKMTQTSQDYTYENAVAQDKYYVNICAATVSSGCTNSAVCQTSSGGSFGCGTPASATFSAYNPNTALDGATINYSEGELCNGVPRMSTINILCDLPSGKGEITIVDEAVECRYTVNMKSEWGCVNHSGGGGGAACGIDCGWIIIIVCSVLFIVYLIAGAAIKWKKFDADPKSLEIIPNVDFWTALPWLVKDGVVFSIRKITCNRVCGEYSEI